jgi:hypothetical protein
VVSGEGCLGPDGGAGHEVWLAGVDDQGVLMPLQATVPVGPDGTWEHRFTLADDPAGIESLGIYGSCYGTEGTITGHYSGILFDVVRPSSPTTPTTPTTPPPTPRPDPEPPGPPSTPSPAPAAPVPTPVVGHPTYTG